MTSNVPVPSALDINDINASDKWTRFRSAWDNYFLAVDLDTKPETKQVAVLLSVIGEEARMVYSTFTWENAGDERRLAPVLEKFEAYCQQ